MSSGSDVVDHVRTLETAVVVPVVIITIVGYDYILTFSDEINNVWRKPWTWVSTLFVIIRYIGLLWTISLAIIGGILLPGPDIVLVPYLRIIFELTVNQIPSVKHEHRLAGTALFVIGDWGYMVFLAAADLVMVLRIYALWGHNKVILAILMFIWVSQVVISLVWEIIYYGPGTTLSVSVSQVLNYKYCNYTSTSAAPPSGTWKSVPRFCLGAALLILTVVPTLRYSIEMYRVTKTWQSNRPIKLLVREGAVYFIVNLLFNIVTYITISNYDFLIFFDSFGYAASCAIMPRFIINVRELYDRDNQNRLQGIDTGFGLFSQSVAFEPGSTSADTDVDSAGYMEAERDPRDSRAIPLNAVGDY